MVAPASQSRCVSSIKTCIVMLIATNISPAVINCDPVDRGFVVGPVQLKMQVAIERKVRGPQATTCAPSILGTEARVKQ